jgi:excinuclease ABC subunit C
MTSAEFSILASTIPTEPGIYKYYSADNELLYVGKAKHLRKRVSSYFTKSKVSYKTHELVNRIKRIEFTIVNSEHEALLLENTLIKQYQPKFNINLKDDKTYPHIVIKNEDFPRVFLTRRKIEDGSTYFGPYTSVASVREILNFIKQTIPLRTCSLNLTPKNIKAGKFKVCLEYHLGNCKGPCEGLQSTEEYAADVAQLKNILKGNINTVLQHFKTKMQTYAANMNFEKAAFIKRKIELLNNYQVANTVVNTKLGTLDVFSILEEGDIAYVNYLAVNNGTIIKTKTIALQKKLDETAQEILALSIANLRLQYNSEAKEIVIPFAVEYDEPTTTLTVPKGGDKKKLLDLSLKNVNYFQHEIQKRKILNLEGKTSSEKDKVLLKLQQDLQLPNLPQHIECFDNSNFQGSYPVAACVVFKNGEPSKNDYRKFKIKTVKGINDFASMKEVVYRRYKRLIDENTPLPQLVIIDGGKGQLSAAMESISELNLPNSTTVVGLAKNEEEIFFPRDSESIKLPWDSESLKLIRRVRDEVHRFGITFHRSLRSKGAFNNELEQIEGIGKSTVNLLLKHFKSLAKVKQQPIEELAKVVGKSRAKLIGEYFKGDGIK